ncbi:hypothetical protein IAQ67_16475 [Paenibacillus peoriae]|uniref:Uncharacterized protein n=1 Tax=Paenibacillus peoriae TaxID=59893 RepID=A0A7H0Y324_9BACL|nr:hypothetical protein [Paenibacillus peoriae]QNR65482.1 hypothetical protein IAQ67_16475 [Paenibacillus peoriae]
MDKQKLLNTIEETAKEYGWSLDVALDRLEQIGFKIAEAEGNERFTESHVKMSVDFAYNAFR